MSNLLMIPAHVLARCQLLMHVTAISQNAARYGTELSDYGISFDNESASIIGSVPPGEDHVRIVACAASDI